MGEFRRRVLEPTLLPLGAIVFIGVLVFALSRILLAVPELGSTGLALLLSAEILGVAAVIATGSRLKSSQRALLLILGIALIGGGGAAAQMGIRHIEHHGVEVEIIAKDVLFDRDTLTFPADTTVDLKFINNDANIPHNVSFYRDEAMTDGVFIGEVFNGIATKVYEIEPLAAGEYPFRCDVHPTTMVGVLHVGEGGEGGHGPAPTASPTAGDTPIPGGITSPTQPGDQPEGEVSSTTEISANELEFDKDQLTLRAGAQVTISFHNEEAIPHNVSINSKEDFSGETILQGEVFSGPETKQYRFESPQAGLYYFRCDVHPTTMKGTVTFK